MLSALKNFKGVFIACRPIETPLDVNYWQENAPSYMHQLY